MMTRIVARFARRISSSWTPDISTARTVFRSMRFSEPCFDVPDAWTSALKVSGAALVALSGEAEVRRPSMASCRLARASRRQRHRVRRLPRGLEQRHACRSSHAPSAPTAARPGPLPDRHLVPRAALCCDAAPPRRSGSRAGREWRPTAAGSASQRAAGLSQVGAHGSRLDGSGIDYQKQRA
jgi:hypothetical protein